MLLTSRLPPRSPTAYTFFARRLLTNTVPLSPSASERASGMPSAQTSTLNPAGTLSLSIGSSLAGRPFAAQTGARSNPIVPACGPAARPAGQRPAGQRPAGQRPAGSAAQARRVARSARRRQALMPSDSGSIRAAWDVLLVLVFVVLASGAAIQPGRRTHLSHAGPRPQ